jgi:hypothetical protein
VKQADVPVLHPPDQVRRGASRAPHLEDLRFALVLPDVVTADDQSIPDVRVHRSTSPGPKQPLLGDLTSCDTECGLHLLMVASAPTDVDTVVPPDLHEHERADLRRSQVLAHAVRPDTVLP